MTLKPLRKALVSTLIGIVGLTGVSYAMKDITLKSEWANFFGNYIASLFEMPASPTGAFGVRNDLRSLKSSIKAGNFYGIADSLLQNAGSVKRALRGYGGGIKGAFGKAFNALRGGRLRTTENTLPTGKIIGQGLFGRKSGQFDVKYAEDFKYTDTSGRFKDVSKFGSGFRSKRRLRESGDSAYASMMS